MADFHQGGVVATLHRLNPDGLQRLENELVAISAEHPIGLVLPALYSEFETRPCSASGANWRRSGTCAGS